MLNFVLYRLIILPIKTLLLINKHKDYPGGLV